MSVTTIERTNRGGHGGHCRCAYCRAIRVEQTRRWRTRRDAGVVFWMDAEPVRAHVRGLMTDYGIPADSIGNQVGVSYGTIRALLYGNGGPPSRRVVAANGERLLTAHFDLDALRDTTVINAVGTRRRVQGLVVAGYCIAEQARRLGRGRNFYCTTLTDVVRVDLARAVRDLADELETVPPPTNTKNQRSALSKARLMARRHPDWVPLAAWDDIDDPNATPINIDEPDLLPDPEEVARILAGVNSIKGLREVDIYRAITQLREDNERPIWAISKRLKCSSESAGRLLHRAGVYELLAALDAEGALELRLLESLATSTVHVAAVSAADTVETLCDYGGEPTAATIDLSATQRVEHFVKGALCTQCRLKLGPFWPRVQRCMR